MKNRVKIQFTDRYEALGIKKPGKNVYTGHCEGTGWVPVHAGERDPKLMKLWREAEQRKHSKDGWHFVKCPTCHGTGKMKNNKR